MKKGFKIFPFLLFCAVSFGSEGGSFWSPTVLFIGHVFNVIVFVYVLYYFLKSPVKEVIKTKRSELLKKLKEADEKEKESAERLKEIEDRMNGLKNEIEDILKRTEQIALKEKEKILQKAKEEADKIKKLAELEVENKLNAAKLELKRYMAELASQRAEEMVKSAITESDIDKSMEKYFSELEG